MIPDFLENPQDEAINLLDKEGPSLAIKQHGEAEPMKAIEQMPEETHKSWVAWEAVMANPFMTKLGTLSAQSWGMLDPLLGGTISNLKYKIYLPSWVLNFKGIVSYRNSRLEEDFEDLKEEILEEIGWFGTITSFKIPHHPF